MAAKLGVIHYNQSFAQLDDFLGWAKKTGYSYVELQRDDVWNNMEEPERTAEKTAALLKKHGLLLSQISCNNDFLQKTPADFDMHVRMVGRLCRLVKICGSGQLRIDGGGPKEGIEESRHRDLVLSGIGKSVEIAEKEGVRLALDNHGSVTNNIDFQLEIFQLIDSKYLGANVDTMNYRWYGYRLDQLPGIYKTIAPYAFHTHMKDGFGSRAEYKGKPLGGGELPLEDAVKELKNAGYNGVWCAECESPDKETGYEECFNWLKKNI